MKDILNTAFQKLINEKKGFKLIAWIFIIIIILAIIRQRDGAFVLRKK